jgi:peroxiredoxin Q/BCP
VKRLFIIVLVGIIIVVTILFVGEERTLLKVGDIAPDFTATANSGEQIHLFDFRGKNVVVLYFYPKDFTAGCTEQACSFRDAFDTLKHLNAVIIGVSHDDASSHARFTAEYKLPFTLLSDSDKSISKAYGAVWFGGLVPLVKRVTYIIDEEGIIRSVSHHEFAVEKHVSDVLVTLRSQKP